MRQTCLGSEKTDFLLEKKIHGWLQIIQFKEFQLPWSFKRGKCKCAFWLVDAEKQMGISWTERKKEKKTQQSFTNNNQ